MVCLVFSKRRLVSLNILTTQFVFSDPSRVLNLLTAPKCGTTPLHDAAENNHLKVVELLVSTGGNLFCFKELFPFAHARLASLSKDDGNRTDAKQSSDWLNEEK